MDRPRGRLRTAPVLTLVILLSAVGCGRKGSPLPPLPRGPMAPEDVALRQLGDTALLRFTAPEPRGDRPGQQPVAAELIRVDYPPGTGPEQDPDAFRRRGEVMDRLQGAVLEAGRRLELADGPWSPADAGRVMRYGVRVLDRKGRPSPLVVAPDLLLVEPLSAPRSLTAEPTIDGIRLVWQAPADEPGRSYNVYRWEADRAPPERALNDRPLEATEYLDVGVTIGTLYRYGVRVSVDSERPYREGATSVVFEVLAEDRFAPGMPDALVAVQEGAAVRLFWNPNREPDVAGYRIWRRLAGGSWQRIGPDPVDQPLYLDDDVDVGQRLTYRVSAVDGWDPPNESERSEPAEIELLADPSDQDDAP